MKGDASNKMGSNHQGFRYSPADSYRVFFTKVWKVVMFEETVAFKASFFCRGSYCSGIAYVASMRSVNHEDVLITA